MSLIVVGMNHRSAPVEVREKVAFSEPEVRKLLAESRSSDALAEAIVLSTCNRTEIYGLSKDNGAAELYIRDLIASKKRVDLTSHPGYAYTLQDVESARHLFRVATGLDSMILGEPQILGQVKQAYQLSRDTGVCGTVFDRLLRAALIAGKRVRNETQLGGGAVSVASAAAELAGKIFRDLSTRSVLLIGVGEMGELTARHMMEKGVKDLTIANRTFSRALELAQTLGGHALPLDRVDEALRDVDIVISSTGSIQPIVDVERMKAIVNQRAGRPLYAIDIAIPRDFEPAIGDLDGVILQNLDAINVLVEKNLDERRGAIPAAEHIVEQELEAFLQWHRSLSATPAIKRLRARMEAIRRQELERHRKRFYEEDLEHADRLTEGLINKILHPLMGRIRDWGSGDEMGPSHIDTVYELFDLPRSDREDQED